MGRHRAKLFTSGGSQAVRLPKEYRFEGEEVAIRREGEAVVLEPVRLQRPRTAEDLEAFWAKLDALRGDEVLVRPPQPRWPEWEADEAPTE